MSRLVVVSNRVPDPGAGAQAGGLAIALDGMMEGAGGLWFGWSGAVHKDAATRPVHEAKHNGVVYATIDLTPEEHDHYYNNFSNAVLWPLLHTMPQMMSFDRHDAQIYREVNTRFADTLVPLLDPDDVVWVHDYHLLALPALLRDRGVRNPIGFFLHIPFATADVIASAPEVGSLVHDMLAADLIGLQTENDADNFAAAAQTLAGAAILDDGTVQCGDRRTRLGVFPVEIEPREFAAAAAANTRTPATERLHRSLSGQKLILGIDRLDPTKGLLQRFAGLRRLIEKRSEWRRRVTLLQIAAVSRKDVASYRDLRLAIDREAGSLNSEWGDPDWMPLRFSAKGVAREVAAGYMREAAVGLVTPLRDGMNLVAKEFVAAQEPADPGVLILSRFAGAARQLDAALLVNPHDTDAMADALDMALRMPLAERQARWRSMWNTLERTSPAQWGRSFVAALQRSTRVPPDIGTGVVVPVGGAPRLDIAEKVRSEVDFAGKPPRPGSRPAA